MLTPKAKITAQRREALSLMGSTRKELLPRQSPPIVGKGSELQQNGSDSSINHS